MREVGHGLHQTLGPLTPNFVEQNGKHDGKQLTEHDFAQRNAQCIAYDFPEIRHLHGNPKPLQPHKGTAKNPFGRIVILKSHQQAEKGNIAEQKNQHRRDRQHQVILPCAMEMKTADPGTNAPFLLGDPDHIVSS